MKVSIGERLMALSLAFGGILLLWEGSGYPFGTISRIGPGFFLIVLGVGIIAMSALLLLTALPREDEGASSISVRPLILLPAAVLVFAFGLHRVGIVPTTLAMTFLICAADRQVTFPLIMVITVLTLSVAVGLFYFGFGVRAPLWRWPD